MSRTPRTSLCIRRVGKTKQVNLMTTLAKELELELIEAKNRIESLETVKRQQFDIARTLQARIDELKTRTNPSEALPEPVVDEEEAYDKWFLGEQGKPYENMWTFARAAWMARASLQSPNAARVPDGYVLVSKEIIDRFPEINPCNYSHDDACDLNAWGVELVLSIDAATQPSSAVSNHSQRKLDMVGSAGGNPIGKCDSCDIEELAGAVLEMHHIDDECGVGFYGDGKWRAAYLKTRKIVGLPE